MNKENSFIPPVITEDDIRWATTLFDNLPENAFYRDDGSEARRHVLMSMKPMDVVACPGSGKTTLLVAKLAILAAKWRYRTQGICVLSHTNAARSEIEKRIGNTPVGKCLLSYPHFIGTIHSFINEYLAIPWLRSKGFPINMIDTETCQKRRWMALPRKFQKTLERSVHNHTILSVKTPDFTVGDIKWRKGLLNKKTKTYQEIQKVCRDSTNEGFFTHNEMFVWADELMDKSDHIITIIRKRFPILFIDEAQDNDKLQSSIIHRIFMNGFNPVIRQRFGDYNQAIYGYDNIQEKTIDIFPDEAISKNLAHSYRFGEAIARFADPLGVRPYNMKGLGPGKPLASKKKEGAHTIFIFDNEGLHADKVLSAYSELLIETFSKEELENGTFTAVGRIHCQNEEKQKKDDYPRAVGQYLKNYNPKLASKNEKPSSFIQYICSGMGQAGILGEIYPTIDSIAEGILHLTKMIKRSQINDPTISLKTKKRHRHILQLLENNINVQEQYKKMMATFSKKGEFPTKESWNYWRGEVKKIAETIAGNSVFTSEAERFIDWQDDALFNLADRSKLRDYKNNFYQYSKNGAKVDIRVGSIHSVKGETHTATLVLETFYRGHNLEKLLKWLDGTNHGHIKNSEEKLLNENLRIHYVAMTRPSHLLCLAMKKNTSNVDFNTLVRHGWRVKEI